MILDRLGRGLVVVALATASLWFTPGVASAAGPCSTGTGVTLVVDFGPLSGGTQQVCVAGGDGDNARQVTEAGGFPVEYLSNGQPFVCRIAGRPEGDVCGRTPPADAYWGLFWSDGSGGWKYSSQGAEGLTLRNGWSVGWRFQDGGAQDLPSAPPRRASSPSPSPTPTSAGPRPTSGPRPSSPRPTSGTTAPQQSVRATPSSTAATATRSPWARRTPSASATGSPSAAATATEPTDTPSEDSTAVAEGSFGTVPADTGAGDDTGLAAVAGLGGLSLLAGSAAVVAYRRNRG